MRSPSGYGSGFNTTPWTTENMLIAMANDMVRVAMIVTGVAGRRKMRRNTLFTN
jgi:hypothetical protein